MGIVWKLGEAVCSYRTYEEWKLADVSFSSSSASIRSYRTYEEWKRTVLSVYAAFLSVLTVPMRNGN